jgi:3'-phosphoadenosine 5'-phosphosulfate (PAPS) 3'-phosphatase
MGVGVVLHMVALLPVQASGIGRISPSDVLRRTRFLPMRSHSLAAPPLICRSAGSAAGGADAGGPVSSLIELCKEACDELSVLVKRVYEGMTASDTTLKADKSVFTIADGLVQHLLLASLLREGEVLGAVVGEEDARVNVATRPYTVDNLRVPEHLWDAVDVAAARLRALGERVPAGSAELQRLTAFVDPIDGTREFSSRLGAMCSICIGFSQEGRPVGGLVYRPLTTPPTWAYGCTREGVARSELLSAAGSVGITTSSAGDCVPLPDEEAGASGAPATAADRPSRTLLASRGSLSPFVRALRRQLPAELVRSGGAGNKALLLLEGAGDCYIQDRGLFRWDTCASQAVLEAHGGRFVKLSALALRGTLESYAYTRTDVQLDFEPGVAQLSAYNAARGHMPGKREKRFAQRAEETKPYANLCGLVALAPAAADDVESFAAAIGRARAEHEMDIS